ncbi:MAG: TonB-dependent receptor [Bacteroidia bacterium]
MRLIHIILFQVIVLLHFNVEAQTFEISGVVTDTSGKAIEDAGIIIKSPEMMASTDNQGRYLFKKLKAGTYQLICFAPGKKLESTFIKIDQNSVVYNFTLKGLSKDLDEFEVLQEREKTYGLSRLRSVEDFAIYEGKKSEVVILSESSANLSTNNARQVFAKVTGLNIWESDGAGLQLGIGGRGLNPNRTASFNVRQNGYDISADALGYPESYYTPPTEALERIEVVRGAASLQYGTQFGGLLNFKFKQGPTNKKAELVSRQTVGSWGFFNSFNSLGGTVAKGRLNYYGFTQFKRGDGYRQNSGFEQVNAYLSASYDISEKWKIRFDLTKMHYLAQQAGGLTDKTFETDPTQSFRARNWFTVDWNLAALQITHKFNSRTELNIRNFGLLAYRKSVGNLERINVIDLGGNRTLIDGSFENLGNETRLIHRYQVKNQIQVLAVGMRLYKGTTIARQGDASNGSDANFNFLNPNNIENSDYQFPNYNAALFAEHIFKISPKFSITPGIRYEYISTGSEGYYKSYVFDFAGNVISESTFNDTTRRERSFVLAGIGLKHTIGKNADVYLNFSQNYKAINFSDLRIVNPNFVVDPNIRDEEGYTADLGIRGQINEKLRYELTGFFISYNGKIGQVLKSGGAPLFNDIRFRGNIADARNLGIESLLEYAIIQSDTNQKQFDLSIFSNLAYVNAKYINSDDPSINNKQVEMVPPFIFRSGVDFRFRAIHVNAMYAYTSEHFSDATNAILTATAVEGLIPSYQIVDLSLRYERKKLSLQLTANNALNESYFTRRAESYPGPGIIPADGRAYYLTLMLKL